MSTQISEPKNGKLKIRDHLESPALLSEIAKVLPAHMSPERMARVAITAMTRTPKLAQCTQASFFKCLLDLSSWGLEPDGRRAHLIPYGKECQLILDYKGIVELAFRSGYVKNIHADVVREGDLFEVNLGKVTKHTPWDFLPQDVRHKDKGDVIAAYCVVEMKDGATKFEVMTRAEIDGIRARSRAGKSGPWVTDFAEMAKKTVFRRASKWLPLSAEIQDAFDRDFDRFPAMDSQRKASAIGIEQLLHGDSEEKSEPSANAESGESDSESDGKLFDDGSNEGHYEEGH